jgi:hypothetical protein
MNRKSKLPKSNSEFEAIWQRRSTITFRRWPKLNLKRRLKPLLATEQAIARLDERLCLLSVAFALLRPVLNAAMELPETEGRGT